MSGCLGETRGETLPPAEGTHRATKNAYACFAQIGTHRVCMQSIIRNPTCAGMIACLLMQLNLLDKPKSANASVLHTIMCPCMHTHARIRTRARTLCEGVGLREGRVQQLELLHGRHRVGDEAPKLA